ncbi:tRNA glutamyl-Q(34) synthetase GluQRS [Endozoicomonas sp. Mp262]|uniref:tRNA glutamyl-Q(34) synthetase GluQRS n=1 Tax=Endozoicomonas sp. Mp262 TaxID=2919499 RepID=UPI0021D87F52
MPIAKEKPYIGRFAPSPSGPLHFGSLVAALASYLDAKASHGLWLVRVEDIDPPREQPGATETILMALDAYGMHWDGEVLYQSKREEAYQRVLEQLWEGGLLYPCNCTRKKLAGLNGVYPGFCRQKTSYPDNEPFALRLKCTDSKISFRDKIQGDQSVRLADLGDFILRRKDLLYAYQLAVCVDDQYQGVTHIVRGYDLLDSTPRQLYLQSLLEYRHPVYAHIPVITQVAGGEKLSKQNRAKALPLDYPRPLLVKAMKALGLQPDNDLLASSVDEILLWGVEQWDINKVPKVPEIPMPMLL